MSKFKTFSYVALVLLLVLVSVIGCRPAAEKPNDPYNNRDMNNNYNIGNIEEDDGIIDRDMGNDMYDMNDMNNNDVGRRSEMIAGKLAQMNGIDRAAVVISDNTAIVGVDTRNNNGNRITQDLRRQIESTVKNVDNRINEVRITNDENLYGRINDIVVSMRTGRPVTEFTNQIREILDRITTDLY